MTPRFSLVLATVGRTMEVERFLAHLAAQEGPSFELLVVDQNPDDRLASLLAAYASRFPLRHLRCERGLSRARNAGLRHCRGAIVAFPDDDCWYPPGLLAAVDRRFADPAIQGLAARSLAEDGTASQVRGHGVPVRMDRYNVWKLAISYGIFLRREVVDAVGGFDLTLGLGAGTPWGSGEETDYLLGAMERGFTLRYEPGLAVHHPALVMQRGDKALERGSSYGAGMGRVLRKHAYPAWFALYMMLRAAVGALLALATADPWRARFHLAGLRGRWRGWRAAGPGTPG